MQTLCLNQEGRRSTVGKIGLVIFLILFEEVDEHFALRIPDTIFGLSFAINYLKNSFFIFID